MERECNKCVHRKEHGCEKWDCEFEPYANPKEDGGSLVERHPCEDAVSRQDIYFKLTNGAYPNETIEQFIDRLVKELKALPPVEPTRKWIPVSERLPEDGERVLVTQKVRDSAIVYGTTFPFEKAKEKYITAWMPKPKPYQPEMESEE